MPAWHFETSKDLMKAHNIKTTIFSVSTPGVEVMTTQQGIKIARQCNEFGAKIRDDDPAHFGFFAMMPDPTADMQAALDEIRYSFDKLHADGILLFSRYGESNDYLGHEVFQPLWDELDSRKAVVFVHPTNPADTVLVNEVLPSPLVDYTHETTKAALDMITSDTFAKHPNCKVILSHAGGTLPYVGDRAALALPGLLEKSSMPTKTTEQILEELSNFYFDVAVASTGPVLAMLMKFAKPGHVLFGSDLPYAPRGMIDICTDNLDEYIKDVKSEEASAINRDNALKLFPRLQDA
ncbi:MAG: hypothetical protein Q9168_006038 [Polycauliona sp. 1 TL-2023]